MEIKSKHEKEGKKGEKTGKSLRSLVKDENKENTSFKEAMEEIWNPEI